jgi:hypothetical protein
MEKQWWCVSCLTEIDLDTHGRCSACGSDAVDRIGRNLFRMSGRVAIAAGTSMDRPASNELVALVLGWSGSN